MSTVNRPKARFGAEFFQQPTTAAHRQYEALRAYFVEGLAAAAVAERFGYTIAAFYALCRDFRAQRLEFFRAPSKPGPKQAPNARRRASASSSYANRTIPPMTSSSGYGPKGCCSVSP